MRRPLRKLLTDTVTHERYLGADKQAKPVFDGPTTCRARVDENRVVRRSADGLQHLVSGPTFVAGIAVGQQDRVTLPDGRALLVFASDIVREPNGALSHSEVFFV